MVVVPLILSDLGTTLPSTDMQSGWEAVVRFSGGKKRPSPNPKVTNVTRVPPVACSRPLLGLPWEAEPDSATSWGLENQSHVARRHIARATGVRRIRLKVLLAGPLDPESLDLGPTYCAMVHVMAASSSPFFTSTNGPNQLVAKSSMLESRWLQVGCSFPGQVYLLEGTVFWGQGESPPPPPSPRALPPSRSRARWARGSALPAR